ncbi:hypothetical protein [Streptomyces sp. NPDC048106]|uniref:hypothetical protein n=1 Tax=Streptomyces sp. NPDC048106 TaxID=3155750 RepID=UPI0034557869
MNRAEGWLADMTVCLADGGSGLPGRGVGRSPSSGCGRAFGDPAHARMVAIAEAAERYSAYEPPTAEHRWATVAAQGDSESRWCPSGGNRASIQMFLLTEADWPGLPGTVFTYDAGTLIAVRADKPSLSELLAGTGLAGRPVRAALVVTGAVYRLRGKYGDFAFRLTHLDAGCALAQCALVAAELGLNAELVTGDTGGLAGQLDLNPGDQLAMGIIGLYGEDTGDAAAGPA